MTTARRTGSDPLVAAILVAFLLAIFLYAGQPVADAQTPQQQPRFQAGVDLLLLDVSVLDAERRPVRGLTAADFTVLEDGRPQAIQTFTAIDVPDHREAVAVAPWTREVAPDVRSNEEFRRGRIVVVVLDDATPMPAPDVLRAKDLARRAIRALGPDDLAALVFPLNQKEGIDFTHDRARLLAVVDEFNGSIDNGPFDLLDPIAATLYEGLIGCLTDVAQNLSALPDRRKALMLISAGLPLDVEGAAPAIVEYGKDGNRDIALLMIRHLMDAFRAAQRANVAIYGFDTGGLRAPNQVGVRSIDPLNPGKPNREFLHAAALNTGGFAVTDTNAPDPSISQILLENSSYYLLGYVPANSRTEGKFRRIEVRVNRPGVTVRTRNGYYEARAANKPGGGELSGTDAALAGALPETDLAVQAMAAAFAQPGKPEAAVAFVVAVRQPVPSRASKVVHELDVLARAYGSDGRERGSVRSTAKATVLPSLPGETILQVASKLDLKPGRYQLRFVADGSVGEHQETVTSASPVATTVSAGEVFGRKSGSVHLDVDVPDFSQPVALSQVAFNRSADYADYADSDSVASRGGRHSRPCAGREAREVNEPAFRSGSLTSRTSCPTPSRPAARPSRSDRRLPERPEWSGYPFPRNLRIRT